jgi:hypothetical protein
MYVKLQRTNVKSICTANIHIATLMFYKHLPLSYHVQQFSAILQLAVFSTQKIFNYMKIISKNSLTE